MCCWMMSWSHLMTITVNLCKQLHCCASSVILQFFPPLPDVSISWLIRLVLHHQMVFSPVILALVHFLLCPYAWTILLLYYSSLISDPTAFFILNIPKGIHSTSICCILLAFLHVRFCVSVPYIKDSTVYTSKIVLQYNKIQLLWIPLLITSSV